MNVTTCGELQGKHVFYFHGAPGATQECLIFDQYAQAANLRIVCLDRFALDSHINAGDYYQTLADKIASIAGPGAVDIIGFSIGCQVAIEVSTLLADRVDNLHLVSAVAPLQSLEPGIEVAGASVFALAAKLPVLFSLLSYWQSLLALFAPGLLFKMLFASAKGDDLALREQADFNEFIGGILISCFSKRVKGYIRDVRHFVKPWSEVLPRCHVNTTIWHGSSDNWSPVAMATVLEASMPRVNALHLFDSLSHYSCLYQCVPLICERLKKPGNS